MNKFNLWWLLPLVSLAAGIVGGQLFFSSSKGAQSTILAAKQHTQGSLVKQPSIQTLQVVQVALPPVPVYQPQLSAKIVNNQVLVTNESEPEHPSQNTIRVEDKENSLLAQRFNQVLADMEREQEQGMPIAKLHSQPLTRYPQWYQDLVPSLEFTEHIYSSKKNESRVRINNQIVKEGELINDRMRIVKIEPQQVIIQMQQRQFSLPALSSW